jgi:hypothetical protein
LGDDGPCCAVGTFDGTNDNNVVVGTLVADDIGTIVGRIVDRGGIDGTNATIGPCVVLPGDNDGTTNVEDGADESCVGDTTDGATVSDVDNGVGIKLGPSLVSVGNMNGAVVGKRDGDKLGDSKICNGTIDGIVDSYMAGGHVLPPFPLPHMELSLDDFPFPDPPIVIPIPSFISPLSFDIIP